MELDQKTILNLQWAAGILDSHSTQIKISNKRYAQLNITHRDPNILTMWHIIVFPDTEPDNLPLTTTQARGRRLTWDQPPSFRYTLSYQGGTVHKILDTFGPLMRSNLHEELLAIEALIKKRQNDELAHHAQMSRDEQLLNAKQRIERMAQLGPPNSGRVWTLADLMPSNEDGTK